MTAAPTFPLAVRFRLVQYLLVLTAATAFSNTTEDYTTLLVSAIAVLISWLLLDFPPAPPLALTAAAPAPQRVLAAIRARGIPPIILNSAVLLGALNFGREVMQEWNQGNQTLIFSLSRYILVLLLCKLFERKTVRNVAQILILSLLLVVAATMFSNSGLFFFSLLAVFLILLIYTVLLLNLYADLERLARARPVPAFIPGHGSAARRARGRDRPLALLRRDLGAVAQHCVFLVLPLAIVVFLTVPRTRGSLLAGLGGVGAYQTGYSDVVQFRDRGTISQSDRLDMTVKLSRNGENVSSEYSDLYLRGQVLYDYDDTRRRWTHGNNPAPNLELPAPKNDHGILVNYTLYLSSGQTLFVLSPSRDQDKGVFYNSSEMTLQDNDYLPRVNGALSYTAVWDKDLPPVLDSAYVEPGVLRPAREILGPEGIVGVQPAVMVTPQIAALARTLMENGLGLEAPPPGQRIPPAQIRTVMNLYEAYLRTNYRYSLTIRTSDPKLDPTTDFLIHRGMKDDNTGGHCEYFASAMVMLCRAVGLNAREVVGYHGGMYDTVANKYVILQKHSHTWAEVYIPDEGWVLSDPTPVGSNIDAYAATGRWFNDILQLLESAWSAIIVNFDNDSRAAIARWFSEKFGALLDLPPFPAGTTVVLWANIFLLLLFWMKLRRRFRRLQPLLASTQGLPHRRLRLSTHVSFLDDLLHFFERRGPRPPDQTPLEFLAPHFPRLGPAAEDARWLVETAYGVRFGNIQVNADLKHKIALALKHVKAVLRAKP